MEVSLGSTGGDVSPVGVGFHLPQFGKEVNDGTFELTGVNPVVGCDEWISKVVDGVLHEFVKFLVVVHEIVGVPEMNGRFAFEKLVVCGEDVRFVGEVGTVVFIVGGDADHFWTEHCLLFVAEGVDDALAGAPCVKDGPGGGCSRLEGVGGEVGYGGGRVVVEAGLFGVSVSGHFFVVIFGKWEAGFESTEIGYAIGVVAVVAGHP